VSLGPPYNWTTRTYEPEAPHAPLPAVLQQAALLLVEVAAQALAQQQQQQQQQQQEQEQEQEESLQPQPQQRRDMQQQEQQQVSGEAAAAPEAAAGECNSAARPHGHTSAPTPEYHPDAALVNYYRSGDTLGGHKDDVERDMSQPIVSISLGCPAVFLMGGESRDVDPTPLLLRSGDVLVLGGPARRCFHGVPRVLPEQGLPPEVVTAAAAAAAEAKATVHLEANEQQAPSPQVLDVAAPAVAAGASAGTCRVDGSGVAQGSGACVDEVGAGGGLAAVVEYMSRARVNISIRATR
jgi:alkylated DNA repair protein alkB family protein 1